MAKFNYKCLDCQKEYTIEVTRDRKEEKMCPQCGSEKFKANYEQPETKLKFEPDGIRCFCALK